MGTTSGYKFKGKMLATEAYLLSQLAANVTETFRSIKAHGL